MHDRAWLRRTDNADTGSAVWSSRVDRGQLLRPHIRADGVMLVEGVCLRECVLTYRRSDGTEFRELVPLSTIRDSAAQIAHLPVCLHHPTDEAGNPIRVDPTNVKRLAVGNVDSGVTVADEGFTFVRMAIRDGEAQRAVMDGTNELSLGYDVRTDGIAGVHPTLGRFDSTQVERRHDHLAIVDRARVGPDAAIRVDGMSTTVLSGNSPPTTTAIRHGAIMNADLVRALALMRLTGRYDSDEAAAKALADALAARSDAADAETARRDAALTAANAERDTERARADAAVAERDTLRAAEAARADAAARTELDGLATALGLDPKAHADTKALRIAIATKQLGKAPRADASDAYLDALLDVAREAVSTRADGRKAGADAWTVPADAIRADAAIVGTQPAEYLSPAQMVAKRNADSFNAARGTTGGR